MAAPGCGARPPFRFHSVADCPKATTVPGLLLYRFETNLVFFNIDHFAERLRAAIQTSRTPVEWVVIDASPINWIDVTALQRLDELRSELATRDITLGIARARLSLNRAFNPRLVAQRLPGMGFRRFPTLKAALHAFERHRTGPTADQAARRPVGSKANEPVRCAVYGVSHRREPQSNLPHLDREPGELVAGDMSQSGQSSARLSRSRRSPSRH